MCYTKGTIKTTTTEDLNMTAYAIEKTIYDALADYRIHPDEVAVYDDTVDILITWGDWKHDHLCCSYVMEDILGCEDRGYYITEEDGSDCYSANHTYKLRSDWRVQ